MTKQAKRIGRKIVGVYIRYSDNEELESKLSELADYQYENNIERIDKYYTEEGSEVWAYNKVITDIFEENIDTLLILGEAHEELPTNYDILEKIEHNIQLVNVY